MLLREPPILLSVVLAASLARKDTQQTHSTHIANERVTSLPVKQYRHTVIAVTCHSRCLPEHETPVQ